MSEASPRRLLVYAVSALAVALGAWAGWYGHLTPPICRRGVDFVPNSPGERIALDNARRREAECDGHSTECKFEIMRLNDGDFLIQVIRNPVDFWTRQCSDGPTDNWTTYHYKASGATSSAL